jgi:hypothetical protein
VPRAKALLIVGSLSLATRTSAQEPAGLGAAALANPSYTWTRRAIPSFRVYFLADSYAAGHQDSLLARLPGALTHARSLIKAQPPAGPIDLFFIETRAQMRALTGMGATGFAEPSTRTVFLVTNPQWRAFERHEIMHVVAEQAWGPAAESNAWLHEGLAQAADGACAGYSNADVAIALARRHGWIPLELVIGKFREQPDLRAYLQAAAFTQYLLRRYGPDPLKKLWREGSSPDSVIGGLRLAVIERRWRDQLAPRHLVRSRDLATVEAKGCG